MSSHWKRIKVLLFIAKLFACIEDTFGKSSSKGGNTEMNEEQRKKIQHNAKFMLHNMKELIKIHKFLKKFDKKQCKIEKGRS